MDFSTGFSSQTKQHVDQAWDAFPTSPSTADQDHGQFDSSVAGAWASFPDTTEEEKSKQAAAVASTSAIGRRPSRRESIEDKTKRRSILQGLSSFRIPGGGNSSVISEDFSELSSAHEDQRPNTNTQQLAAEQISQRNASDPATHPPPRQIELPHNKNNHEGDTTPNGIQHSLTDPQQQSPRVHAFQRRPRRSSLQDVSFYPKPTSTLTSKSVRFQFDDNRVIMAGELSSHAANREAEEKKEESIKRDLANEVDDHGMRSKTPSSKKESQTKALLAHSSPEHNPADKRHKQKQSKDRQKQKRLRQHASLNDLGFHVDTDQGSEEKKQDSMEGSNASQNTPTKSKRSQKTSGRKRAERLQQSMGNISMDVSIDTHVRGKGGVDQTGFAATTTGDGSGNQLQKLPNRKQALASIETTDQHDGTISTAKHLISSVTTEINQTSTSVSKNETSSPTARKSSRSNRNKVAKDRRPTTPRKDKKDQSLDRRKLLRKNSSLSELEVIAKHQGRRKTKTEPESPVQSEQQRMHQSLRSFGSAKELDQKDVSNKSNDLENTGDPHGFSLLNVDIDIRESTSNTMKTHEAENESETSVSNARNSRPKGKSTTRENNRHTRQLSPQRVSVTKVFSKSTDAQSNNNKNNNNNSSSSDGKGQRELTRRASRSSLTESEGTGASPSKGKQPEGRKHKSKAQRRLQMHKSLGNIEAQVNPDDSSNMNDKQKVSSSSLDRRSEHGRVDSKLYDTPPLATSLHGPTPMEITPADAIGSKRNSGRVTDTDMDKSHRRGSYHNRMIIHRSLHKLSADDDGIENRDQDVAASSRSSWSDRVETTADRKSKRRSSVQERGGYKSSISREDRKNLTNGGHGLGGSSRSLQKLSSPSKKIKKKLALSQDTDTTAATSTTAGPSHFQEGEGPIITPPKQNRHKLLRKNSSLNDLIAAQEVSQNHSSKEGENHEKLFHKSLRQVDGEPLLAEEERGRRRRSSVERRKISHHTGAESERKDESGKQVSRRARSRSKSRHRKPSNKRKSERARSRSKSRARSRSRHGRKPKTEAKNENVQIQEGGTTDDYFPRHIFVDNDAPGQEGGPEECFSSIEGVSVELDRKREARKKAKEEANATAAAALHASMGSLDLRPPEEIEPATEIHRLNKSMGNLSANREKNKKSKKQGDQSLPEVGTSPELRERPVLLRSDSGISSLGFPPPDRKKKTTKVSPDGVIPQIPKSIELGAGDGEFMPSPRSNAATQRAGAATYGSSVVSQSPTQQMHSSFVIEPPPIDRDTTLPSPFPASMAAGFHDVESTTTTEEEEEKPVPRWKSRLSTHSILNVFNADEPQKRASDHEGARRIQTSSRNLLVGITEQKKKQAPTEQVWNVLSHAFLPDEEEAAVDRDYDDYSSSGSSFA